MPKSHPYSEIERLSPVGADVGAVGANEIGANDGMKDGAKDGLKDGANDGLNDG